MWRHLTQHKVIVTAAKVLHKATESRSKLSHFLLIAFLFVQHEHCTTGPELLQVYMSISSRNLQKDIYYFTGNSTLKRFELSHRGYVICGC